MIIVQDILYVYLSSLTSISTTILAMKMNVRLKARNSSRLKGRQPLSVHLFTAGSVELRQNNCYITL